MYKLRLEQAIEGAQKMGVHAELRAWNLDELTISEYIYIYIQGNA